MSWKNILKSAWYVRDGDAPLHDHVHELLFFMAYNEDPKLKQAGEALLNKFDEYYERVEDKENEDQYMINHSTFLYAFNQKGECIKNFSYNDTEEYIVQYMKDYSQQVNL